MRLLPVSVTFIVAEFLDIVTTVFGILAFPAVWESNPIVVRLGGWLPVLFFKIVITLLVVTILNGMNRTLCLGPIQIDSWKLYKAAWIVPIVAGLPVLWNLLVLLFELWATLPPV